MNQTVKLLTVGQIRKFSKDKKYIALRHQSGFIWGVNAKSVFMFKNKKRDDKMRTEYISIREISFMEYISIKIGMFCK